MNDKEYLEIYNFLVSNQPPETLTSTLSNFKKKMKKFTLNAVGSVLVKDGKRIVVRKTELDTIWSQIHDHSGIDKCLEKFRKR